MAKNKCPINLNKVAKEITIREGLKKQISIAQIKEVLSRYNEYLSEQSDEDIHKIVSWYRQ